MVGVDRAEGEHQAGELPLRRADQRVDALAPGDGGQRVGVAAVLGPRLVDQLPAGGRVGLVPGGEVAGGELSEVGGQVGGHGLLPCPVRWLVRWSAGRSPLVENLRTAGDGRISHG